MHDADDCSICAAERRISLEEQVADARATIARLVAELRDAQNYIAIYHHTDIEAQAVMEGIAEALVAVERGG